MPTPGPPKPFGIGTPLLSQATERTSGGVLPPWGAITLAVAPRAHASASSLRVSWQYGVDGQAVPPKTTWTVPLDSPFDGPAVSQISPTLSEELFAVSHPVLK